jgi:hypothetical protein
MVHENIVRKTYLYQPQHPCSPASL